MPVSYEAPQEELSAEVCFNLLKKALNKKSNREVTFRELWGFCNVLYTALHQLHDEASPLNAAMKPDPFVLSEVDAQVKEAMKGEVVNFLVRTARDFASNDPDARNVFTDKVSLNCQGFSRSEFCRANWRLQAYEVANCPVYKAIGSNYYLYFRSGSGKWVIDDEIVPSGAAYATSATSSMNGVWYTSSGWEAAPYIKVSKASEGYVVSGCKGAPDSQGASSSLLENGLYLTQPGSEKVNGQLQYILQTKTLSDRNERRHLIWSSSMNCWKITPTCGEEEGSYCVQESNTKDPSRGTWNVIPKDKVDSVTFFSKSSSDPSQTTFQQEEPAVAELEVEDMEDFDDENEDKHRNELDQLSSLIPWNSRNHESLVFSNKTSTLAFFAANPARLRERMNPALIKFLELNKIVVGEDLHRASTKKYLELLCALTNVSRTEEEASKLMGGRFAITGDALLKFLAIFMRLRCGIPVVLLGECGCGKTFAIKFLAQWLSVKLFVLDVHGGTNESDVLDIITSADAYVKENDTEVMVFLDEINACAHLGLIEEVLVQRRTFGKRVDDRICLVAALNPYREYPKNKDEEMTGLTYDSPSKALLGASSSTNKNLVYLVHPVPSSLVHLAFDFGALKPREELFYVTAMCATTLNEGTATLHRVREAATCNDVRSVVVAWICQAQAFIREKEGDPSAASLRDAQRCLSLMVWFLRLADSRPNTAEKPYPPTINCAVLALAFAYMFRLSSRKLREQFWESLREHTLKTHPAFGPYKQVGGFESVLSSTQRSFCGKFQLEPGIALNEALSENLFLSVVCILNKIPLFLVGKPGTSKTLALQIAASNLLGKSSPIPYWRRFPALAVFTYQCSPLSTAIEIKKQFDVACRFQLHANEQIAVFVLDEVGLAEFSPSLPLKVLHSILVNPPVAVVGVSNWTLDRAKMNRAILLTRPEPEVFDLRLTGARISQSFGTEAGKQQLMHQEKANQLSSEDDWWLKGLADTFYELYTKEQQAGREFWGMRDYYALVRQLKKAPQVNKETLVLAVCRNLGGKPEVLESLVKRFVDAIFTRSS